MTRRVVLFSRANNNFTSNIDIDILLETFTRSIAIIFQTSHFDESLSPLHLRFTPND